MSYNSEECAGERLFLFYPADKILFVMYGSAQDISPLSVLCNLQPTNEKVRYTYQFSSLCKLGNLPRLLCCHICAEVDGYFLCVFAGWAHVVCALYIPEVEFANVSTMEPIVLQSVPHERYNKVTNMYTM